MDINDLKALISVIEHGSLQSAATATATRAEVPMLLLSLLIGCATPDSKAPEDSDADSGEVDSADQAPCTPLAALFFDLGDTLVVEGPDALFMAREGATELLDELVGQRLPIGVITNVPRGYDIEDLRALLADPAILDVFDTVLLSSEAEAGPKPDPAIFVEAVGRLAEPPPIEQRAFVTEELADLADGEPPTEGARAAGMIGVHLSDDAPSPLADHTVATDALPSIATAAWLQCIFH